MSAKFQSPDSVSMDAIGERVHALEKKLNRHQKFFRITVFLIGLAFLMGAQNIPNLSSVCDTIERMKTGREHFKEISLHYGDKGYFKISPGGGNLKIEGRESGNNAKWYATLDHRGWRISR